MNRVHNETTLSRLIRTIAIASIALLIAACNDDVDVPDGAFDEKIVDISGSWQVTSVLQNGKDITGLIEFSRLQLTLNNDTQGPSTYSIENDGIPFIVTQSGDWQFDDKIYPREMIFSPSGESITSVFVTPPISGGNDFAISFALGCEDNKYVYHLTRQ